MRSDWRSVTLGDVAGSLAQYRPHAVALLAVVAIVALLPTTGEPGEVDAGAAGPGATVGGGTGTGGTAGVAGSTADAATGDATTGGSGSAAAEGTTPTEDGDAAAGADAAAVPRDATPGDAGAGGQASEDATVAPASGTHPRCDTATGRMMVPMLDAPGCVPAFPDGADNGGQTYRGVSDDTIVVAIRESSGDSANAQAAGAILTAAGADDDPEEVRATRQAYIDMFEDRYEFYGREIELVYFESSGSDDAAGRADAIKVATEIGAFAALGGGGAYMEELVARGVPCVSCTTSQPRETYLGHAPYVWSTLMSSTQAYMHRMTYACRLWGGEAEHAGDPTFQVTPRKLAIVYFETEGGAYKSGVDFAEQYFADRCGGQFAERISYIADATQAQEQARTVIAKMKDAGVTTVVFAGDPFYPVFYTQEATRQNYYPEWMITGSALTDTTLFARTYDQTQWANAFGVSMQPARGPQEAQDAYRLHEWYWGQPPEADGTYGVIFSGPWLLATGIHHAGPNLTPATFQQGMFAWPPTPGGFTHVAASFGQHGIWEWDDYLRYDDMTEIWWDPNATGEDEIGNEGVGMYRYVDGGRRYLVGDWPSGAPDVFDPAGTVTVYEELPEEDRPPDYPCDGCPSQEG